VPAFAIMPSLGVIASRMKLETQVARDP